MQYTLRSQLSLLLLRVICKQSSGVPVEYFTFRYQLHKKYISTYKLGQFLSQGTLDITLGKFESKSNF